MREAARMENYTMLVFSETQKKNFLHLVSIAGATATGETFCDGEYYIQITATPTQADTINAFISAGTI